MTEVEWLQSAQTHKMKRHLGRPLSPRKCLLTLCAYARHVEPHIVVPRVMEIATEFESGADSEPMATLNWPDCDAMQHELLGHLPVNNNERGICYFILYCLHTASQSGFLGESSFEGIGALVARIAHPGAHFDINRLQNSAPEAVEVYRHERAIQIALTLDTIGNPFCPVTFSSEWRTDTAIALARQMYESREFSAMPILADALQDAGCDNDDILDHCRGDGPHVRGCWVVDLVLGKS